MKKFRRITALLAAAAMLAGAVTLPVQNTGMAAVMTASAEAETGTYEALTYENYGDHIEITGCDADAEAVEIPAEMDGVPVTEIGEDAFYPCRKLTSVTIPEGVTSLGDRAFFHCVALTSITIPDSVTEIGRSAFANCNSLTSVTLPDNVEVIRENTFSECTSLTSVTLPKNLLSIEKNAFYECSALTSVALPEGLTSISGNAFYRCFALETITIPASVTEIGDYAFNRCDSLTDIDVMDGNARYSSVDGVLLDGTKLIRYPEGRTETSYAVPSGVTGIGEHAFSKCMNLTDITFPESLTEIGWFSFIFCTGLTSVTIPEGVTTIGAVAFQDCTSLTSVTLSKNTTCIEIGAFNECESLTDVWYSGTLKDWREMEIAEGNECLLNAKLHCAGMPEEPVYGDVNGDDEMDLIDVIMINKHLMIGEEIPEQMKAYADVDRNGTLDEVDSLNILKAIIHLIELPLTD